jgi:protein SCO1/2
MLVASARLGALLGFVALSFSQASAHEADVRGLVLGTAAPDHVILRHGALLGMPAGISTFRILPARELAALRPGTTIEGLVDADSAPPTLANITSLGSERVTGAEDATSAPKLFRTVHHMSIGEFAPSPPFLDQLGRRFTLKDLAGGPLVMAFVYTRCRDARECPLISAKFKQLQERFAGTDTHLLLVTLDPAYDTPRVLARYATTFGADPARWRFATGDPDTVLDFAAQFDVTAFPDERVGLIHPERTVILDGYGAVRELIDESSWAPDEIVATTENDQRVGSSLVARVNLWLSEKAVAVCGNAAAGFSGFTDLLTVLAIAAFFSFVLFRVARGIARGAN